MIHAIVACARSWIGTRFHHQGRIKKTEAHKGGVDCLGLLAGVAAELDLRGWNGVVLKFYDEQDYSHAPDTKKLKKRLCEILHLVDDGSLQCGDVLLLSIEGNPQHLGIVSDYGSGFGLIHAYAPARTVVEHALDALWLRSIDAVFRI